MSSTSPLLIAAYLRVAADSISLFDYLQTFPAEIRLYRRQKNFCKPSMACILFIVVRYLGFINVVLANIGFFYHGFSANTCKHYFMLTPVLKLFLYMSSQVILGIRTYAVSRRSPWVLWMLVVVFILCTVPELLATFYRRIPVNLNGACTGGNPKGVSVASYFYVGALAYDLIAMTTTFFYLIKFSSKSRTSITSSLLAKLMLEDGIMYFLALSAMNVLNFIFFRNTNSALQPSASTLGMATTMIFSSRFILNLSEHARGDGRSGDHTHSSRSRGHGFSGGRRGDGAVRELANSTSPDGGIVVRVVKDVITMNDMSGSMDVKHTVGDESDGDARSTNGTKSDPRKVESWGAQMV
uniref:DUF6533 domain-containing protein n=1 Tax=Mycena chlorophos TaxID=658473 RepID=A0ABQ0M3S1_MYCCL|nr:predicted protein [Mycena chlorophos]